MRPIRLLPVLALLFATVLSSPPATAQEEHVVSPEEMQEMVETRAAGLDADRAALLRFLRRPEVRRVAEGAGVDLRTAETAVPVLEGPELERLAGRARAVERALAGGNNIVIPTTTLIIVLLVVLIIVLAD